MSDAIEWYIVKSAAGTCKIVSATEMKEGQEQEQWGPFATQGEAIAKRVGLIRAGKCQPE
jgi:hypothetical protein